MSRVLPVLPIDITAARIRPQKAHRRPTEGPQKAHERPMKGPRGPSVGLLWAFAHRRPTAPLCGPSVGLCGRRLPPLGTLSAFLWAFSVGLFVGLFCGPSVGLFLWAFADPTVTKENLCTYDFGC